MSLTPTESAALLGEFFLLGKEGQLDKDIPMGLYFLEKAAEKGYLDSQKLLWDFHLLENNPTSNRATGEKWLKKAASSEDAQVQAYAASLLQQYE